MSFIVKVRNDKVGQVPVDRALLPSPPGKRSGTYQATVDALVAFYGTPILTRKQLVAWLKSQPDADGNTRPENLYMRDVRWMTNARNKYRPAGPRTAYVLPLTTTELATLPAPAPAATPDPAPEATPAAV